MQHGSSTQEAISVPYDVYESSKELVLLIPVGGVDPESIRLEINDFHLFVTAQRQQPELRDDLVPKVQSCYWGPIQLKIALPPTIYFDKIHSKISTSNILTVVIPKNIIPEHIPITIEKS